MIDTYTYNLLKDEDYSDLVNQEYRIYQEKGAFYCKDIERCISEEDFYPPDDNRILKSYLEETHNGEYVDYLEDFFDMLEEEGYYD